MPAMSKLTDLKRMLDAARAKRPAPGPGASADRGKPKLAPGYDDIDFAKLFADVTRLPPPTRARIPRPRPLPHAAQREADDADALLASKFGAEPSPQSWEIGQEHDSGLTFLRRGLGTDVLGKLRRGHWALQGEIDLHGLSTEEAHDALADFLVAARGRGARCVRVIHGKGLTSPGREPVLKGKVRHWLSHWDEVLAYCEAPRHAGGGGAVLVLLKGAAPSHRGRPTREDGD